MSDIIEVLFTSDSTGTQWTCGAWEPRTSTNLMSYKGGGAAGQHSLCILNNEFLVSANNTKPLLHMWPINSQDQVAGLRFVTPGKVSCLVISPDGNFLVAGIQESIYVWEICSGRMMRVLSKHYQEVTTIRFVKDGFHFVSGSRDGSVLVWNLAKVVEHGEHEQQPLYFLSDHALPVTDIFIGSGGMRAVMCTVSVDRTCRLYDLSSGNMLLNVVFREKLTSVVLNTMETEIYVGSSEGPIYTFNVHAPPRMKEYHISLEEEKNKFLGHHGAVNCLALSTTGEMLASGGNDGNIYIWDVNSKQLLKTLAHQGPITNALFILAPRSVFNPEVRFNLVASNLKRMMEKSSDNSDVVEIIVNDSIEYDTEMEIPTVANSNPESSTELEELRNEIRQLKKVNKELFEYSVKNVLRNDE